MRAAARIVAPVTAAEGFPTRAEVVERYARRTGFDVADIDWYQAFAFFKLAVVCQGIAARAAGGAMLGSGFDEAQRLVAPLVAAGRDAASVARTTGSADRHAAVHAQHVAGDEAAGRAEQEEHGGVELARQAAAAQGRARRAGSPGRPTGRRRARRSSPRRRSPGRPR